MTCGNDVIPVELLPRRRRGNMYLVACLRAMIRCWTEDDVTKIAANSPVRPLVDSDRMSRLLDTSRGQARL